MNAAALRSLLAGLALPTASACSTTEGTAGTADPARDATGPDGLVTEVGRVLVERDPVGLRVEAASGDVVLRSLRGSDAAGGVPYAALGFTTAAEPELAPPSFEEGGVVSDPPAESRHHAIGVVSASATEDGYAAELETNDPEGRRLSLKLSPMEGGLVRVDLDVMPPDGVTGVFASFEASAGEAFHGFGGRRESTNLRGHTIANWVHDYRFPDVSTAYYYPQPMFLSSAGFGLWVATDRMATFRMASDRDDAWRVIVEGAELDLVVAPAGGKDALRLLTAVTGRHRVAPSWSMGATPSRTIQIGQDLGPDVYRGKVEDDVARILAGDLPIEAYAYEGWIMLPEEQVRSINDQLRAAGVHPILYIRSFVADDIAGTEPAGRIAEAIENGYVALTAAGAPYLFPSPFPGADAAVIDFTVPEARQWWKRLVHQMLALGADGFMNDFGEQVLADMVFADGSTGATMHNRYPVLQHQLTREAVDEFVAAHPEREIYFYVRAGYGGAPGSAAFENATFPGDESVDFKPLTGLPSIVPDMLNRGLFGAYGFSTDIGGYADFEVTAESRGTDAELFTRWTEAAVFTTHFRIHNSALSGVRMPWSFDEATLARFAELARLHERARPLMRRLWAEAQSSGVPPIRPLFREDPSAEGNPHCDDEWMVGSDVLVAPVLARGATSREVWLPEGCWQLHGEGEELQGHRTVVVDAPIGMLPWFTRCGTTPL
jgi:sulfoquinovosidase